MEIPPISRKIAFLVSYAVLAAALLILNVPRYLEIRSLDRGLTRALKELDRSYEEYMDQKRTLDMIKTRMKNVVSFDDLKSVLPKSVNVLKEKDRISIEGSMKSEEFNEFMDFVTRASNMAIYSLKVWNDFSSPFTVGEEKEGVVNLKADLLNPEVIK